MLYDTPTKPKRLTIAKLICIIIMQGDIHMNPWWCISSWNFLEHELDLMTHKHTEMSEIRNCFAVGYCYASGIKVICQPWMLRNRYLIGSAHNTERLTVVYLNNEKTWAWKVFIFKWSHLWWSLTRITCHNVIIISHFHTVQSLTASNPNTKPMSWWGTGYSFHGSLYSTLTPDDVV